MTEIYFKLNTGASIPALGLGTWQSAAGQVERAVSHAIDVGYRHVDCAFCYQNEYEVGRALTKALGSEQVKRKDLFVTTKLWCTYHNRVEENLDLSLKNLGLDYVDLYLMHWPVAMNPAGSHPLFPKLPDGSRDLVKSRSFIDTWKDMEKLLKTGKTKAIGVSNCSKKYLAALLSQVSVVPAVSQIENHPYLPQQEVVDFCKENGIHVTAYSPLGSTGGPLMTSDVVVSIAKKKGVSPGNVLLSFHFARGISVLAKSVTPSRIDENKKIIPLDATELAALENFSKANGVKRFVYPEFGVNFGFPDKNSGMVLLP